MYKYQYILSSEEKGMGDGQRETSTAPEEDEAAGQ